MRVYLDTCVLGRLTDRPTSARVVIETEACKQIFVLIRAGRIQWSVSTAVDVEIRKNPDPELRRDTLELLDYAGHLVRSYAGTLDRTGELISVGYGLFDAAHLALAEQEPVDALLTTDERFIRLAARHAGAPQVNVENPVEWLRREGLWHWKSK